MPVSEPCVRVVVVDGGGSQILHEMPFTAPDLSDIESGFPCVAVRVYYDSNPGGSPNLVSIDFSGHDAYDVFGPTADGHIVVQEMTRSGSNKSIRRKLFPVAGGSPSTIDLDSSLVDALAAAGGVAWPDSAPTQAELDDAMLLLAS